MNWTTTDILWSITQLITTTILTLAIPWAFKVHGRMCSIETAIKQINSQDILIQQLFNRLNHVENRIAAITGRTNGH